MKKNNILSKTKSTLKSTDPLPPRLYGLLKVHKSNILLRQKKDIIFTINEYANKTTVKYTLKNPEE